MKFETKNVYLKNGEKCVICSPESGDEESLSLHKNIVRCETHFLMKSSQGLPFTPNGELERIEKFADSDSSIMIVAKLHGKIVGLGIGNRKNSDVRMVHRFELAISVQKEFWGLGIGSQIMSALIEVAKDRKFEQVELSVASENESALHLYEKFGFKKYGTFPHSMKLSDGTYSSAYFMLLDLKGCIEK